MTKGVFKVTEVQTQNGYSNTELLEFAAYAESYSNHPIAVSIIKEYGKEIDKGEIDQYNEISGHGIKVNVKGHEVLAGNARLMRAENVAFEDIDAAGTIVYIAVDKAYAGYILISDEVKEDAKEAIFELKKMGSKRRSCLPATVDP